MKTGAVFLASLALFIGACASLVGIGELPGTSPDGGGSMESGGRDAPTDSVPRDGGVDSSRPRDASAHDATHHDAPLADVFDGGAPLKGFPSHTKSSYYVPDAGPLTGITTIDTSALTLNGTTTLPAGVGFALDGKGAHAVLSVGTWDVEAAVTVTGGPPLIVVAAGDVTVNAFISGAAVGPTAGPGAVTGSSPGVGAAGCLSSSGGGQGGGFGTTGGLGGTFSPSCPMTGGKVFGALISEFSGGGSGGAGDNVCGAGIHGGLGGGGGGAVQISSAASITITSSGGIAVSGGGGEGGCPGDYSGAGGGAGGMVFLEAPTITVAGGISANGGGGGTGDDSGGGGSIPGSDGMPGLTPAPGGPGSSTLVQGGAGAAGSTSATDGTTGYGAPSGGGGGLGRLWFRTRGSPATTTGSALSGEQSIDTSL